MLPFLKKYLKKLRDFSRNMSCDGVFTHHDGNSVPVTASQENPVLLTSTTNLPVVQVEVFYAKVELFSYCGLLNHFVNMIAC